MRARTSEVGAGPRDHAARLDVTVSGDERCVAAASRQEVARQLPSAPASKLAQQVLSGIGAKPVLLRAKAKVMLPRPRGKVELPRPVSKPWDTPGCPSVGY